MASRRNGGGKLHAVQYELRTVLPLLHHTINDTEVTLVGHFLTEARHSKYNQPGKHDEEGFLIDDVLSLYDNNDTGDKNDVNPGEEAQECSDEDESTGSACSASEFEEMKKQCAIALNQRSVQWKTNGMDRIFNCDFSLSVDSVLQWLQSGTEAGTGKQLTRERETRFTEYNDDSQMNVTCRENVSILNHSDRKQFTAENTSNYEYKDNNRRRVIVHQIEKQTISSYITMVKYVPKSCLKDVSKKKLRDDRQRKICFKPEKKIKVRRQHFTSSDSSDKEDDEDYKPLSSLKKALPQRSTRATQQRNRSESSTERQKNTKEKQAEDDKPSSPCEYPMPANYRQMLIVNGRCPYNTEGTVIYRPKPIHRALPRDADKICLRTDDLDLSRIKSMAKRKKFANFCRLAHPNSTLVYYMSESEDDEAKENEAHELSWDDDDPILTYRPMIPYEVPTGAVVFHLDPPDLAQDGCRRRTLEYSSSSLPSGSIIISGWNGSIGGSSVAIIRVVVVGTEEVLKLADEAGGAGRSSSSSTSADMLDTVEGPTVLLLALGDCIMPCCSSASMSSSVTGTDEAGPDGIGSTGLGRGAIVDDLSGAASVVTYLIGYGWFWL
uniref:Uncharacterized protein n=1 Tax=Anopheles dirus TaxID=7168 RepID=A0A182NEI4_9DIPT